MSTHWRLPKGVDEVLPPHAWELEGLRRKVLDVFVSWGYDYLEPPVIEYLDALLVGSGEDLDLQTLKVVDQSSGRQLGVRADMTSQAVRVDAHSRRVAKTFSGFAMPALWFCQSPRQSNVSSSAESRRGDLWSRW